MTDCPKKEVRIESTKLIVSGAGTWSVALIRAAVFETPLPNTTEDRIKRGAAAHFPVRAGDLMPDFQGVELGEILAALKRDWIASDFTLSAQELLKKQ